MVPDFSGYATRNDLVCSDGKTIRSGAFAHQDQMQVPIVWQHQHKEVEGVLGHGILENREDGTYVYGYLNKDNPSSIHARNLIKNGTLNALSIFANKLTQRNNSVYHGDIKEVSLVLAGANPGAMIDTVNIAHADGAEIGDEAIIFTDDFIEHDGLEYDEDLEHAESDSDNEGDTNVATAANTQTDRTVEEVYEGFTDEERLVVDFLIGEARGEGDDSDDDDDEIEQSDFDNSDFLAHATDLFKDGFDMARNVFATHGAAPAENTGLEAQLTLSHAEVNDILEDAQSRGSLKEAVLAHANTYGVENIDILFPDAKALSNTPEIIGRRTEWVADVLKSTKHVPFTRIKSTAVDLTADEARAKGYVKGNLKKDEIIKLLKRVTTPTTIYKKQKLDRDDIVDITDLDVVAWLKAEMRLMLDEELARAILIGDGRESDDEDKIDEDHIRPIATDVDMYAHKVTIQSDTSPKDMVKAILRSRHYYKGTGTPTLYTTDQILTDLILDEDKMGRRLYNTEQELASALRVSKIVVVEVMTDAPEVLAIIVNLADYTIGADKGGNVSMFDDFDIDYNQYKYLIETRVSGTLTKPKSAVVLKRTLGIVVTPENPSYNGATKTLTVPNQAGVVYSIDGVTVTGSKVLTETSDVEARPATGYSFPPNTNTDWTFVV